MEHVHVGCRGLIHANRQAQEYHSASAMQKMTNQWRPQPFPAHLIAVNQFGIRSPKKVCRLQHSLPRFLMSNWWYFGVVHSRRCSVFRKNDLNSLVWKNEGPLAAPKCAFGSFVLESPHHSSWKALLPERSVYGGYIRIYGNKEGLLKREEVTLWRQFTTAIGVDRTSVESNLLGEFKGVIADRRIPAVQKDGVARKALDSQLGPHEISNMLNCMKKGGYMHIALLENLAKRVLDSPSLVEDFTPIEMSMSIHSLAVLSIQNSTIFPSFQELLLKLVEECVMRENLGYLEFNEQSIANVVYAFGLVFKKGNRLLELDGKCKELLDVILCKLTRNGERPRLRWCREQHLANIMYALGRMEYKDRTILDALGREIRKNERLEEFTKQHLTNIVYALGLLRYHNEEVLNGLASEIGRQERLRTLNEQEFSNIVYGFGLLGYSNDQVLDALGSELQQPGRMKAFREQALSNIVYGLGLLKYKNVEVLNALCVEISKPRTLHAFKEQGLSAIIYGLGLLEHYNEVALNALCQEIGCKRRLEAFKEQELANITYGLGLLKYKNYEVLHSLCKEMAKTSRLGKFKPQEISIIVYALGKLHYCDEGVLDLLCKEMEDPSRVEAFLEQGFSNILYGLGLVCDLIPISFTTTKMESLLESMGREVVKDVRMDRHSLQGLSNIAWAIGALQYLNIPLMNSLIDKILEVSKSRDGVNGGLDGRELRMALHACAGLNHAREDLFDFAVSHIDQNVESMPGRDLVNYLWSLSVLGALPPELFHKMCVRLGALDADSLLPRHHRQILQAYLYAKYIKGVEMDENVSRLVEKAKDAFRGEESDVRSPFELDVARILDEFGIGHMKHHRLEECIVVDMLVEGDSKIVVEADGPSHYTINKVDGNFQLVGETQFRNKLLQSMGFKVLCIPYFSWHEMTTDARKKWLKCELDKLQKS